MRTAEPVRKLSALAFVTDPELPPIRSPYGSARFLTVVGITADELDRMKATTTAQVVAGLAAGDDEVHAMVTRCHSRARPHRRPLPKS